MGAAIKDSINILSDSIAMNYPMLYPTQITSSGNKYTALSKNDGADDETVCMSNSKERDDEWTQATEDLTSEDDTDDESWYIPPTNHIIHPTHVKLPTRSAAWKAIVQANNLQATPNAATIFDVQQVTRSVKHAISDSGATGHFLVKNAPATNIRLASKPITITLLCDRVGVVQALSRHSRLRSSATR